MKRNFYYAALVLGPAIFACGPVPPPNGGTGGAGATGGTGGSGGGGNPTEASWCGALRAIQNKCQNCHGRPTAAGAPMSLVNYTDTQVARFPQDPNSIPVWKSMQAAIASGRMPQVGTLTAEERAAFDRWFAEGAPATTEQCQNVTPPPPPPAGPEYLPCPPSEQKVFRAHANPTNPSSTTPYVVPAGADNLYVSFPFPTKFVRGEQAIAWAPVIDNGAVIHHYILYGTQTAGAVAGGTFIAGWAPGGVNAVMAPDLGLVLDYPHFYLQVHYNNPGNPPTNDASGVAFCTVPPERARPNHVGIVTLGSVGINIPPGAQNQAVTGTCNNLSATGKPLTIVAGSAHMHLTGTGFKTDHFNAAGQSLGLITNVPIGTWKFDDQKPQPVLQRRTYNNGERLVTTCYFSNTSTRTIRFGEGTDDEMCFDFMSVYPIEDAKKLCLW